MNKTLTYALLIALPISIIAHALFNTAQRNLSDIFTDTEFSRGGAARIKNYHADRESSFPQLNGKDFFTSIDDLSICRRESVRYYIYCYLTSGKEYCSKSISRSFTYLPIIENSFEKNSDLPSDLAMLPLLESGFDPNAVSPTKATGLWQFVSATAREFGLKNDLYVEERKDIEKSTDAAIRHLRHLFSIYNNWELALAAYNGGSGYVDSVIKNTGERDYWKLAENNAFKKETNEYVARFAALLVISKNYKSLPIKNLIVKTDTEKTFIHLASSGENIQDLAARFEVNAGEIRKYNPELKCGTIPPYETAYELRIPGTKTYAMLK